MTAALPLRIVAPIAAAYLLFLAIATASLLRPAPPAPTTALDAGWRAFLRRLAATAVGGYLAFLAIVAVFHVWIAGQHDAMRFAVPGGALLAFGVALPAFVLLTALERLLRPPRSKRDG